MASWYETNEELQKALRANTLFVEEDELAQEPNTFFGPTASQVKAALPELLGGMPLTDRPWEQPAASKAWGIGPNNTYWVLDPKSGRKGIWVLDSSSSEATRNAQAAHSATQYGFYRKVTSEIPPIADLMNRGLVFENGFKEAFYRAYPEQDPRPKKQPPISRKVKTFELFGLLNGGPTLATDVLSRVGPGDYVLADGAQLLVGDEPGDGFGLAGDPGKWNLYYPGLSPGSFGLSPDKGVLMWDGEKGVVLSADLLRDIYGDAWKSIIYG